MESLNVIVIYFLICAGTLLQVSSHVLNIEHLQNNLNSGLKTNHLVPENQNVNSVNVNRVKKSPAAANSPYTTTICVQVRPDNATNQLYEEKQNLSQQTSARSDNSMLNQHFRAQVAQQKPSERYQINAMENIESMPMYFNPSRQRIQAPQVMQIPSSFLNSQQMQQMMIQKDLQARNKEAEQRLRGSTNYFNPQIKDHQLAQMKPVLVQIDHQQDEVNQQSNLDKNTRLMGNQYYRTYNVPDKEMGTAQYQIPSQVLPTSPLAVTKQYVLSSYPRSQTNTGEPAEFITSNVPLTLNCDVSPDSSPKDAVKIAQYTVPRQTHQAQHNFYPTGSLQGMKQIYPFPQGTYNQQQIKYVRPNINNPWGRESQKIDPEAVVYKGVVSMLEQMNRPKVTMDDLARSMVYWRDPSQMFTPNYNYELNEERKSSERDNQNPQNEENFMDTSYIKQAPVTDNGKDWAMVQPVRALTEEELKIKEKQIEEQLRESQARLEELQKQLKVSKTKTESKDSNESGTEEIGKRNELSTAVSTSTTKTPSESMKRSVSKQKSAKRQI